MLDEPAAGLSRPEKLALADLLRALREEGVTVLLVEHDMEFVMGLVDRIVVMDFGSQAGRGRSGRGARRSAVQEAYLGRRGMTRALEIEDLHVAYGKVEAVRGVALRMQPGQIVDRHRAERRRQDHAACGHHGTAALARPGDV